MSDQDPYGDPTRAETPVSDATMPMPTTPPPTDPSTPGEPPPGDLPPTGEPPPPDRRPWLIIGLLIVLLLVGFALLFNDDDDAETPDTTTSTTSSTTSSTTDTTEATATTASTSTTAPPTTIDPARCVSSDADDPDTTAAVVFEAYTVGDQECASNLMTADALDQLFGIPGAGGGWTFMGCEDVEDPDPQTLCGFRFEGGSTSFRMNYSDTDGWTVFDVFQTAD